MAVIFEGKKLAKKIREQLKKDADALGENGITPKLVSLLVGRLPRSKRYLSLKKRAAKDIGAKLEIRDFGKDAKRQELIDTIEDLNGKKGVHGIMIQLPLPEEFSNEEKRQIIESISNEKDIDGMKERSIFVAPVVKATLVALKDATKEKEIEENTLFVVVGAEGFVGRKIFRTIEDMGYRVKGVDIKTKAKRTKIKDADIVISATGKHGVIGKDMVKKGAVVIDLGAPKPDIEEGVEERASFVTPVPGGIGPLTVEFLIENLLEAARERV